MVNKQTSCSSSAVVVEQRAVLPGQQIIVSNQPKGIGYT